MNAQVSDGFQLSLWAPEQLIAAVHTVAAGWPRPPARRREVQRAPPDVHRADVARDGIEGMLKGEDAVVAGSFRNRVQAVATNLLPEQLKARLHAGLTQEKDD